MCLRRLTTAKNGARQAIAEMHNRNHEIARSDAWNRRVAIIPHPHYDLTFQAATAFRVGRFRLFWWIDAS